MQRRKNALIRFVCERTKTLLRALHRLLPLVLTVECEIYGQSLNKNAYPKRGGNLKQN
jgi:hypothetical protein